MRRELHRLGALPHLWPTSAAQCRRASGSGRSSRGRPSSTCWGWPASRRRRREGSPSRRSASTASASPCSASGAPHTSSACRHRGGPGHGGTTTVAAAGLLCARSARLARRWGEARLLPGALRLVKHLAASGVPYAIATSTPRASLVAKLSTKPEMRELLKHAVRRSRSRSGSRGPLARPTRRVPDTPVRGRA